MKFIYVFITTILMILPLQGVPYAKLDAAFDQKNAESIVALAKEKVLLNILGKEGVYSRSQALLVLKDFFNNKGASNFSYTFKSSESETDTFAIGNLSCNNVKHRVTIHFKATENDYKIESITIEKE
ncbi:MAG: DUF4783 domain-containing protein [Crocinitomicaceae bacterium]|nr:DUF4783 domain-containing protein [Crocinitomicaceae bacterium]